MTYVLANQLGRTAAANFFHLLVSNKLLLSVFKPSILLLIDLSSFLRKLQGVVLTSIPLNNYSVINARGYEGMFYLDNLGGYR